MITMFNMKELIVNFDTSSSKAVEKMWKLWAFEYLQIACYGSVHIVGLVTSQSLIKYA